MNIGAIYPRRVASFEVNRNLEATVNRGEFCYDFYFSLQVIWIEATPLGERKDDIPA